MSCFAILSRTKFEALLGRGAEAALDADQAGALLGGFAMLGQVSVLGVYLGRYTMFRAWGKQVVRSVPEGRPKRLQQS